MTIKQEREVLFHKSVLNVCDKMITYGNVSKSKEEVIPIAAQYVKEVFKAADDAYTEYLKEDGE
tara:strand:- start:182 stop:373 length:192 start_codon:yes stop_codon:yes gene_type:complete